ncbi:MAG: pyridoxine 5'-phosphate synthase [bacterium]
MSESRCRLGVNIDHVATLRQARGTAYPDLAAAARECLAGGAHGITIHLREDRRHIQDRDLHILRREPGVRLNLEMAIVPEIVEIACSVRPHEVCLVPERRHELTTEGGLDVAGQAAPVHAVVTKLAQAGIVVSLFIDPDHQQIEAAARSGAPAIELHTGTYCNASEASAPVELTRLIEGARLAHRLGLKVNAGHGLSLDNLHGILSVPHLDTLNIGHSLVCRAVFVGLRQAVAEMLAALELYTGGLP